MHELNEPQRLAVLHDAGPLLIFAGAGSGKTRTLTYRIANLLSTHRVPPYRILAVTFTNKAASEMRERLEQLTGPDVARDLWMGTFHSVCARLLRRYHEAAGLTRSFVIYDDSDQKSVLTRIIKEQQLDERQFPPRWVLSRIHAEKQEGRTADQTQLKQTLAELYTAYQQALARADAVDFDDLLLKVLQIVEDPDSEVGFQLRQRFSHVLVDEFQDTNITQYRLVRALSAAERNLCAVGDDDQSIYSWRGADVRIIRGFKQDFPDAQVIKLEQNYRSTSNIVAAALGVIRRSGEREDKELWTAADAGEKVCLQLVPTERDEAERIATNIAQQLADGIDPKQIAIFYRIHAQSRVLEEALRRARINYQIIGGPKFFERAEVKDLLAYLRLTENPRSDADLVRIINVPTRGIGAKTVAALLDKATETSQSAYSAIPATIREGNIGSGAKKKLAAFHELLEKFRAQRDLEPSKLAELILEETGYRALLEKRDNAESDSRLENLSELLGSIYEYEQEAEAEGRTALLAEYLERVSLISSVDSMDDSAKVSLMTVHGAKGLEFEVVYLTGMEEETFPYRRQGAPSYEDLDEERRLAYVAITRARRHLFISYCDARTLFGKTGYRTPSQFLRDIPEEVVIHKGQPARMSSGYGRNIQSSSRGGPSARAPGERVVENDFFDDTPSVNVRPGDSIHHFKFGRGIVQRVECSGQPKVIARFRDGVRTIVADALDVD